MKLYFLLEIKRALISQSFLVGIALTVIGMVLWILPKFENYPDMFEMGRTGSLYWFIWLHGGYTALFSPVLATIPFARSYAQDRNSGFSRFVLQRLSTFRYSVIRLVSNALAGGLVLALPSAGAMLWVTAMFPMIPRIELAQSHFFWNLSPPSPIVYMGLQITTAFMFGATTATLGLAASVLFRNSFYANVIPFFLYTLFAVIAAYSRLVYLSPFVMWDPSINTHATTTSFTVQYFVVWLVILFVYIRFFRAREQ